MSHSSVQECFQITTFVIERDPYALEAMPLHFTAAVELKKKNELFLRAHRYSFLTSSCNSWMLDFHRHPQYPGEVYECSFAVSQHDRIHALPVEGDVTDLLRHF